ncbi:MAG: MOSC domain-containing protein [Verrucomicrobiota bacterium]
MKIRRLYISKAHNFFGHHGREAGKEPMLEVAEVECVAGSGLRGDRFFDYKPDYKGQVTFFSLRVYEELCQTFQVYHAEPSIFRRNVITTDVDLNELIGCEFEVQGIRFEGTQEAAPCYWMNQAFHDGAEAALQGRGGLRARILTNGFLRQDPQG